MGPIELLILIALGVAIGTSFRRLARAREEHGPDAIEASSGHLMALLGVRVGAVLLVVSVFTLVAIGNASSDEDYSGLTAVYTIVLLASILMLGFGGVRLHQDRQAALAMGATPGQSTKRCPHCAETIQAAASVCRYCGHDVEPQI